MESVRAQHLERNWDKNDAQYFVTFLADRFYPLNERFARAFEKRFGGVWKPIYILSGMPNELFRPENFLIVNRQHHPGTVCLQDYEDQNVEFSTSPKVKKMLKTLLKKQGRLFIVPFTASHLTIKMSGLTVIAPRADLAKKYDNKIEHIKLFERLGVATHRYAIFKNADDLRRHAPHLPACYLSAPFTSGGAEAGFVYGPADVEKFLTSLREVNAKGAILATRIVKDIILAPNVNAIVLGKDKVEVIAVADQVLHGNAYLGNIYPSKASKAMRAKMIEATKIVGRYLSRLGYRGLFGIDFLIDRKGGMYATDLNPRRQGGYFCNVLMSKKVDLVDLEVAVALGEKIPAITMKDFQCAFAWGHSKIKPHGKARKIRKVLKNGDAEDPFHEVGAEFSAIFYEKDSVMESGSAGYYVVSGKSRSTVAKKTELEPERILKRVF